MSAYRQNYTPAHQRPAHAFAPGAIEHHIHSRGHQRRALVRWLKRAALAMLAVCLLGLLATGARAGDLPSPLMPSAMGLHIGSHHFSAAPAGHQPWNNSNPGVYARWPSGLTVGTLRNSERRQSVYAAWTLETPRHHRLAAAITAGAITGYAATVSPLLSVSASLAVTERLALRVSFMPKAHAKASAVAHLSAEWRF